MQQILSPSGRKVVYQMNGFSPYDQGSPWQNGQGGPFASQRAYWQSPQWQEKRKIRHTTNVMGWACFAVQALMSGLTLLLVQFLYLIGYPFSMEWTASSGISPTTYYLLISLVYIIAVALPFVLCMVFMRLPVNQALPFEKVGVGTGLLCIFMGVGACMFSNIPSNIVAMFFEGAGFSGTMPESVQGNNALSMALSVIQIAIIPALVEELAFRGVILSQLRRFGNGLAVFGSALLFAFYHGNFLQFTFTFLVGLVLGFIMIRTNNLWITVIIHAVNNGISVPFSMVSSYLSEEAYTALNSILFVGLMLLGVVSLVILLIKKREFFQTNYNAPMLLPLSTRLMAFITNPGFVAFFALFFLSSVESLLTW